MRAWSRRYILNSVATWSLRDRPARNRPASSAPSRSMRPRSSAVWTSSSSGVGTNAPERTSSSSWSMPLSRAAVSDVERNPACCKACACAREPARSYGAKRQSNCVDRDNAVSALSEAAENRPPHKRIWSVTTNSGVALCRNLARQTPELYEALGQTLVEHVASVIGGQGIVVQRFLAP